MKQNDFLRYQNLYKRRHTASSGAAAILNEFLGFPIEQPVPLSLSHGVDFGHCFSPMEIESIEPVHWAYNRKIFKKSSEIKPALLIPHPWIMLKNNLCISRGKGTLIIGPPPGPKNDVNLFSLIRQQLADDATILIKQRGQFKKSVAYWNQQGFNTIYAHNSNSGFYSSLFSILSNYERVIGCTFSSALVFAAAMDKHVDIIRGYKYRSYDTSDYSRKVDFFSEEARSTVRAFITGSKEHKRHLALSLLGSDPMLDRDVILSRYMEALNSTKTALHGLDKTPACIKRVIFGLANKLDRPGLARLGQVDMGKLMGLGQATFLDIDEFSVWEDGPNKNNLSVKLVPYRKGITEPGLAVEQY